MQIILGVFYVLKIAPAIIKQSACTRKKLRKVNNINIYIYNERNTGVFQLQDFSLNFMKSFKIAL